MGVAEFLYLLENGMIYVSPHPGDGLWVRASRGLPQQVLKTDRERADTWVGPDGLFVMVLRFHIDWLTLSMGFVFQ
jgi:hypothetical protein